jgi:hypothetical protein
MSGPTPGPGPARNMSVGTGPQSAGIPQHGSMPQQQGQAPPPAGAHQGPQSQQNLNQIVSSESHFLCLFPVSAFVDFAACTRGFALALGRLVSGGYAQLEPGILFRTTQLARPYYTAFSIAIARTPPWTNAMALWTTTTTIMATGVCGKRRLPRRSCIT